MDRSAVIVPGVTTLRKLALVLAAALVASVLALGLWPLEAGGSLTFSCGSALLPDNTEAEQAGELVQRMEKLDDIVSGTEPGLFEEGLEDASVSDAGELAIARCEDARSDQRLIVLTVLGVGAVVAIALWVVGKPSPA